MSGLLVEDREIITNAATAQGFRFMQYKEQSNWIALLFESNWFLLFHELLNFN
jgi:ribosomal protein L11 methylase PrmA